MILDKDNLLKDKDDQFLLDILSSTPDKIKDLSKMFNFENNIKLGLEACKILGAINIVKIVTLVKSKNIDLNSQNTKKLLNDVINAIYKAKANDILDIKAINNLQQLTTQDVKEYFQNCLRTDLHKVATIELEKRAKIQAEKIGNSKLSSDDLDLIQNIKEQPDTNLNEDEKNAIKELYGLNENLQKESKKENLTHPERGLFYRIKGFFLGEKK